MESQKICFLQYDLRGGGAERKVCTLANYFVSKGYTVEIGLFGSTCQAYTLDEKVRVVFINRENYEYKNSIEKWLFHGLNIIESILLFLIRLVDQKSGERFARHFKKRHNYIMPICRYIYNRQNSIFITMMAQHFNEIMRIIEKDISSGKINVPYIVMECNNPKPGLDATEQVDKMRNQYYPMASKCVMMTNGAKSYFNKDIQDKSVIIPNPVRDDLPEAYYGERRLTIVTYCRLSKQKNLTLLIRAFKKFHSQYPDYTLEIYGDGEERELLDRLIVEKGLEKCVSIYPFDPQVHQKIKDCAMFVSSSDWEGWSNSIMEALALAMPVIATDCDFGPRDMITDHMNGLLVPVGDVNALVNAMTELAENHELAEMLGRNAAVAREIFSMEKIGSQWLELIEEVKKEYV